MRGRRQWVAAQASWQVAGRGPRGGAALGRARGGLIGRRPGRARRAAVGAGPGAGLEPVTFERLPGRPGG
jgi:hypothetical protein